MATSCTNKDATTLSATDALSDAIDSEVQLLPMGLEERINALHHIIARLREERQQKLAVHAKAVAQVKEVQGHIQTHAQQLDIWRSREQNFIALEKKTNSDEATVRQAMAVLLSLLSQAENELRGRNACALLGITLSSPAPSHSSQQQQQPSPPQRHGGSSAATLTRGPSNCSTPPSPAQPNTFAPTAVTRTVTYYASTQPGPKAASANAVAQSPLPSVNAAQSTAVPLAPVSTESLKKATVAVGATATATATAIAATAATAAVPLSSTKPSVDTTLVESDADEEKKNRGVKNRGKEKGEGEEDKGSGVVLGGGDAHVDAEGDCNFDVDESFFVPDFDSDSEEREIIAVDESMDTTMEATQSFEPSFSAEPQEEAEDDFAQNSDTSSDNSLPVQPHGRRKKKKNSVHASEEGKKLKRCKVKNLERRPRMKPKLRKKAEHDGGSQARSERMHASHKRSGKLKSQNSREY